MKLEYELRNNAKVASSFSDAPEKVSVFSLTRGQNIPMGVDNRNLAKTLSIHDMIGQKIYLDKIIDHESMLTA